jgi:Single-strand binding protein family
VTHRRRVRPKGRQLRQLGFHHGDPGGKHHAISLTRTRARAAVSKSSWLHGGKSTGPRTAEGLELLRRRERTQGHQIPIFNEALGEICQAHLRKGSKVYLEGSLETRSFKKDGERRYVTEIVFRPFHGEVTMLDNKPDAEPSERPAQRQQRAQTKPAPR